jgi:hypothetical protein
VTKTRPESGIRLRTFGATLTARQGQASATVVLALMLMGMVGACTAADGAMYTPVNGQAGAEGASGDGIGGTPQPPRLHGECLPRGLGPVW